MVDGEIERIGRTSCVFRRVRDTAKSDNGGYVNIRGGVIGRGAGAVANEKPLIHF